MNVLLSLNPKLKTRAVGSLRVIRTRGEPAVLAHLGPDLLGHSWDPAEAVRRLSSDPGQPIGLALLDQRLIAGIGDVYRSEVLFLARAHPHTPAGEVADLPRLVDLAHELVHANRDRARRLTAPASTREQYWVYGRGGRACLRCGDSISHGTLGAAPTARDAAVLRAVYPAPGAVPRGFEEGDGRDVFWCPQCQPLPANPGRTVGVTREGARPPDPDPTKR